MRTIFGIPNALFNFNENINIHRGLYKALQIFLKFEMKLLNKISADVAMTRAKERLHVCYAKERYGKEQQRSRFIDEYLENYSE